MVYPRQAIVDCAAASFVFLIDITESNHEYDMTTQHL